MNGTGVTDSGSALQNVGGGWHGGRSNLIVMSELEAKRFGQWLRRQNIGRDRPAVLSYCA